MIKVSQREPSHAGSQLIPFQFYFSLPMTSRRKPPLGAFLSQRLIFIIFPFLTKNLTLTFSAKAAGSSQNLINTESARGYLLLLMAYDPKFLFTVMIQSCPCKRIY